MKWRGFALFLAALLMGTAAGGWWLARQRPAETVQFLTARGISPSQARQVVCWLGGQVDDQPEPLVASGNLEAQEVAVVSELGGRVLLVLAEEGEDVYPGQVLIELDPSALRAQLSAAQAAVRTAEAQRDVLAAGAHPAAILAAEAALQQAVVQRDGALLTLESTRRLLEDPQDLDLQIAEAETRVELASIQIDLAQAQIEAAEAERDRYRAQGTLEEKGRYEIHSQHVAAAEEALRQTQAAHAGGLATLAQLRAIRAHPLALSAQVHQAEGQVGIAQAGMEAAQAALDDLLAKPAPEELAVAEAQVEVARAALVGLQVQRDMLTLRSPIAGLVAGQVVHAGEIAQPGATLMTIADPSEITLTVYVPTGELGRVYIGQGVEIQVHAFPQSTFAGHVAYISPEAEFTPQNVQTDEDRINMVFAVRIRVPNLDLRLRPGMPADVTLLAVP
jgi:HlyD family secretion protein